MSNEPMPQNITILPQIEDLLYPLKPEELAHLEASIRQHGVREPLCLWDRDGEFILVDGHNRYAVATRNGVTFPTTIMEFKDLEDVLDWVDKNQIGRRNLTDEERAVTLGRIYQRKLDQKERLDVYLILTREPKRLKVQARECQIHWPTNGMSVQPR